jgi:hypothetical protein
MGEMNKTLSFLPVMGMEINFEITGTAKPKILTEDVKAISLMVKHLSVEI